MMVLIFLVLFLALLGVAWRRVASALRIASVRAVQTQRDEGSIPALALAMHLLETGLPPISPYVCGVTLDTSGGPVRYTVTFTAEGATGWSVHVGVTGAGANPSPMPNTFATIIRHDSRMTEPTRIPLRKPLRQPPTCSAEANAKNGRRADRRANNPPARGVAFPPAGRRMAHRRRPANIAALLRRPLLRRPCCFVLMLVMASMVDAVLTIRLLQAGGDEINPLMDRLLDLRHPAFLSASTC